MRRSLVVLVIVVSTILLAAAPAWAPHMYLRFWPLAGHPGTYSVQTQCSGGKVITIKSGSTTVKLTVPRGRRGKFTTTKLRMLEGRSLSTVTAYCGTHQLDLERRLSKLAFGGAPVLPQLGLGIGLITTGILLVVLGLRRREAAGP